jgi:hypothetical protein
MEEAAAAAATVDGDWLDAVGTVILNFLLSVPYPAVRDGDDDDDGGDGGDDDDDDDDDGDDDEWALVLDRYSRRR